jgi:N-acetylmuramoyl-L-alanine amidase
MTQEEAIQKLNITVDLIPAGSSNRPGTKITPTFVTIHNTANADPGADAAMHARYVKGADARARQVSWHFTVDDKRVFKHLPTDEKAWHAGPGNSKSVAIEVCENRGIDTDAAIDRAALLTALMMLAYGIGSDNVVPHQHWTGKDCPHVILRRPGGFDAFRKLAAQYRRQLETPGIAGPGMFVDAASDEPAGQTVTALYEVADASDGTGTGVIRRESDTDTGQPNGSSGDTGRMAELERTVVQLAMENVRLRQAIEAVHGSGTGASFASGEGEAD